MTAPTFIAVLGIFCVVVLLCVLGYCCFYAQPVTHYNTLEMLELSQEEKDFKQQLERDGLVNTFYQDEVSGESSNDDGSNHSDSEEFNATKKIENGELGKVGSGSGSDSSDDSPFEI